MPNVYEHLEAVREPMLAAFDAEAARGGVTPPAHMTRPGAARYLCLVRDSLRAGTADTLAAALDDGSLWKLYAPPPDAPASARLVRTNWTVQARRAADAEFARWYATGVAARPVEPPATVPVAPAVDPKPTPTDTGAKVVVGVAAGAGVAALGLFLWKTFAARPSTAESVHAAANGTAAADALMGWAYEQVDGADWGRWTATPGDERLMDRFFPDKPDLMRSTVEQYLAFHAWVWGREASAADRVRMTGWLQEVWTRASVHRENEPVRGVLAKVWAWHAASRLPTREREAVRSGFRERIPDGTYAELEPGAAKSMAPPAGSTASGGTLESDFRNKMMNDLLRNMGGSASTPPGFQTW